MLRYLTSLSNYVSAFTFLHLKQIINLTFLIEHSIQWQQRGTCHHMQVQAMLKN